MKGLSNFSASPSEFQQKDNFQNRYGQQANSILSFPLTSTCFLLRKRVAIAITLVFYCLKMNIVTDNKNITQKNRIDWSLDRKQNFK